MYRIVTTTAYDGCMPVTVYVVQKKVEKFFFDEWVDIRAYQSKETALRVMKILKGETKI